MGGVILLLMLVLVCGFGTGMIVVYQLRRRKEKRQSMHSCHILYMHNATPSLARRNSRVSWKVYGAQPNIQWRYL